MFKEWQLLGAVSKLTGEEPTVEHAPEYGERLWRIKTSKWNLIYFDAGNGHAIPITVETGETRVLLQEVKRLASLL